MDKSSKTKIKKSFTIFFSIVLVLVTTIFATMYLFNLTDYGVTIASFGTTIFMILSKKGIKKRIIFGSYLIAVILGIVFSELSTVTTLNVALAAISSVILMTIFEFQHAPAIGISIAMVLNKYSFLTDFIVLLCIFIILIMAVILKIFLHNPSKIINFIEIEEEKIKWNFKERKVPEYLKLGDNS
jgi:hypothetical protein